jgi:2-polyprenyl-6-hydroxyphenyl methylase/3-demethylubiquinone-9 3-methyltransferase
MSAHSKDLSRGNRFEFGKNWQRFLKTIDEARIAEAERSLTERLEIDNLQGKSFLDIGSGSGLFSLAARRLGARVHSFDYDAQSVACTAELKRRYFSDDVNWNIEEGSVVDDEYMQSIGKIRRGLLMGCIAPHWRHVASLGQRCNPCCEWWKIVYCDLQRSRP